MCEAGAANVPPHSVCRATARLSVAMALQGESRHEREKSVFSLCMPSRCPPSRCKDSANRVKYKKKVYEMEFLFLFHKICTEPVCRGCTGIGPVRAHYRQTPYTPEPFPENFSISHFRTCVSTLIPTSDSSVRILFGKHLIFRRLPKVIISDCKTYCIGVRNIFFCKIKQYK